jgi:tripartite-type tricarboxylate transporter receptor subunit TctC
MQNQPSATKRYIISRAIPLTIGLVAQFKPSFAQTNFPSKPIRIIVPFSVGGVADLTARAVAQKLSEQLGQPVLIENKPGAGGIAAGETVARAEPDGHTLLLISNGTAVSSGLFKQLPFNPLQDFFGVSTLGFFDLAIIATPQNPFATLDDLISFARKNPGKLNVGSINFGSTQNLAAELFKQQASIDVQIVPFNGTPALISGMRSGDIEVAVEILGPVMAQVRSKAVRVLATLGAERTTLLPDTPTAKERGLGQLQLSSWNGLAAPAKTPKEIVNKLSLEINAALKNEALRKKLADLNVDAKGSTPEATQQWLASETKRWGEVIAKAGIAKQ